MDTEVSSQRRELNLLQNTELLARAGDTGVLQRKLVNNLKAESIVSGACKWHKDIIFVKSLEVMIGEVRTHVHVSKKCTIRERFILIYMFLCNKVKVQKDQWEI